MKNLDHVQCLLEMPLDDIVNHGGQVSEEVKRKKERDALDNARRKENIRNQNNEVSALIESSEQSNVLNGEHASREGIDFVQI